MLIHPVILSGGSGTRLWPLSREQHPKQLLALLGERTMLQETVCRLDGDGVENIAAPIIVCNEEYRFLVTEQMRQLGKPCAAIILEAVGKNTAPALTFAALALTKNGQDALMLVMPADHVIQDGAAFHAAIKQGAELAQSGHLVTFGITPDRPETGYGYIKKNDGNTVAAFVEKPDVETARRYLASGEYLWNSGIFMMRALVWLEELNRFQADMLRACRAAYEGRSQDGDFVRMHKESLLQCPADSIDYAVMEKTKRAKVVPLTAGWSDVGAWSAFWEICPQDAQGNVIQGDVLTHMAKNSLLISQHRFVAALGLENMIVVETADAVLVAHKDQAQHVKEIVAQLKVKQREEYKNHRKIHRPWGSYETVDIGSRFQVKRIIVNPGAALSLQMHHHRAEHWVVVKGTAKVTRGEESFILSENQSTYIPLGMKHRLENPGTIPLEIIEVQSGGYLGEDDIVRFEDKYNRGNKP
jgi:mannose-1-phosphate guanylyltransferase / mannose-6-phosphate isomerase